LVGLKVSQHGAQLLDECWKQIPRRGVEDLRVNDQ
jgi:hypothetical protein